MMDVVAFSRKMQPPQKKRRKEEKYVFFGFLDIEASCARMRKANIFFGVSINTLIFGLIVGNDLGEKTLFFFGKLQPVL